MSEPKVVSRRSQRLRRIRTGVLVAVAMALVLAVWLWRANRTETRKPGEELPEITRRLALDLPADAPEPLWTEIATEAGLGGFRSFAGERSSQLPEDMGSGAAWGDYDDDGDDDLFLVAVGGALNAEPEGWAESMLYENLGDGTLRRVTGFPEVRIVGMAAAWGDADGDGRLDLALSGYNELRLYRNTGDGFLLDERFPSPEGYWAGLGWADFDNDRDLDLYVCGYVRYVEDDSKSRRASEQYGTEVPYTLNPASFEPQSNLLLENAGDGTFRDVAALWGVSNPEGRSLSALWHDFDADGRLDLYVANDISDNALYLNRGETFEDVSLAAWVADYRGAMGLAAGDWNRDGDDDLFVTHWLAQENALYDSRLLAAPPAAGAETEARAAVPLTFSDQSAPLGLGQTTLQMVGWGTEFADFDGDGWLDLMVANGSTLERKGDGPRLLRPQTDMLFWNEGGRAFHDLVRLSEELGAADVSRGLAISDYDRDGDLDVLIQRHGEAPKLWRNEMQTGTWVELDLRSGTGSGQASGSGLGSTVVVQAGGVDLRRTVGGASYLSQSSATLHFGLGEAASVSGVEVQWLGGERERFEGVSVGGRYRLVEGTGVAQPVAMPVGTGSAIPVASAAAQELGERERVVEFWRRHREAMDRVKRDADCPGAVPLFRSALELDPDHEDARYYLANCLQALGQTEEALEQLNELRERSPMSYRGHKQWGVLRAMNARGAEDLSAAAAALERSLEVNREQTGSLTVLAEVRLLEGDLAEAGRGFEAVCQTNSGDSKAQFLRGYVAWKSGELDASRRALEAALAARGPEWKPEGTVAEGDVAQRMHLEESPLAGFADGWNGAIDPDAAYRALDAHLAGRS